MSGGDGEVKRLRSPGERPRQTMELLDKGMAEDAQRIADEVEASMPGGAVPVPVAPAPLPNPQK